ncbi:uncharacterized protein LOC110020440 isoform X2 [Phalaenopsis equestris]|uniref:uncharacterized protein LOC110020440 isoform X2 n=1 Tax=Phalaenopsis equestris TaxID=78828 RepID=UPI0009E3DE81|nr:uncharacterized protein LOC110020440 isoform X2 [Phalaenopsis equestris]
MSSSNTNSALPSTEHDLLLDKLEVFKVQDHPEKPGRKILRIIGKFFPAKVLKGAEGKEALKKYLERRIFPEIGEAPFCIVYVHTSFNRPDNFPAFCSSDRSTNLCLPPLRTAWRSFISFNPASGPVSSSLHSADFSSAPARVFQDKLVILNATCRPAARVDMRSEFSIKTQTYFRIS